MPAEVAANRAATAERIGGALILGAGFGRRFGSDKRRYLIDGVNPMLLKTLSTYAEVFDNLAVVLRPEDEELNRDAARAFPNLLIIYAQHAHLGMGHSLAAGIRAIKNDWRYVCVGLADMPHVRTESLTELESVYLDGAEDGIVQPVFKGRPGHPVIFGARYFDEMSHLSGDGGARSVIQAYSSMLKQVPLDDPGVVEDVDVPP